MPLFGRSDEAQKRFKEAKRCIATRDEEFNLDRAIYLLEEAVVLKPDVRKYRQKLEELTALKSKLRAVFQAELRGVLLVKDRGDLVVTCEVQQGIIRSGDKVRIVGIKGEKRYTVAGLEVFARTPAFAIPGDLVGLLGLLSDEADMKDMQAGDMIEGVRD
jgi:translation elongation factor EF-Tu-like GTPase